jgi:hypothetical protein
MNASGYRRRRKDWIHDCGAAGELPRLCGYGDRPVAAQLDRLETGASVTKVAADITQGDTLEKILGGKYRRPLRRPLSRDAPDRRSGKGGRSALPRSDRGCRQHPYGQSSSPKARARRSFLNAVWRRDSSPSWQAISPRISISCRTCACASAPCPKFPSNALNYNLTWSTDGVINEYCEPCEAIVNGQLRETQALEELEEFSLDGILYEAFNTSGGLGTLCETLAGKVRNLNYRTIRYPGHAAIMKALLNDLRLRDRRELLKDILENAVPITLQDVVIVFVTVSGMRGGQLVQETYANKIYAAPMGGRVRSAIQITTAGRHLRGARHAAHG